MKKHCSAPAPTPIKVGTATVGVHVPIIEKDIYFNDFFAEPVSWRNAMRCAENSGRRLPSLREAHVLLYFWEQLRPFAPDLFTGQFWTATELEPGNANAWFFSEEGCVNCISKQVEFQIMLIADPE